MRAAITTEALTVSFGRFVALSEVDFAALYGQVHGLIGPNGAGKTTLLDAMIGKSPASAGRILLEGTRDLAALSEVGRALAGIGRKFQKPSVFDALTVQENLDLALRIRPRSLAAEVLAGAAAKRAAIEATLEEIGLAAMSHAPAGVLSHGQKQWLEIGMVLIQQPKVLLLDEPAAGMSEEEVLHTTDLLRRLRTPERSIVVVEHDMDFVEQIADTVTVLHEGRTLFEGGMAEARQDPRVIEVYIGR